MIEPAEFDEQDTPYLIYSGKKWPTPPLGAKQLSKARKPLIELEEKLQAAVKDVENVAERARIQGDIFNGMEPEEFTALVLEPIYQSLTRAHPKLGREEFLDMATNDPEMIAAWFSVRRNSGVFVFVEGNAPGEAKPAGETQKT